MLAATSSSLDRDLDSVKLVLLLEARKQDYPETLKSYFRMVLEQTMSLLNQPEKAAADAMPEAISLAVKLTSDRHLRDIIQGILGADEIPSDKAETALSSLEASLDSNIGPAHLSKDIYAAI